MGVIRQLGIFLIVGWIASMLPGCRSAPSTPPSSPEPSLEQPAPAPEAPQAPELVVPPPKPKISRVLPESMIAAPEKDSAALRVNYNTLISVRAADSMRNGSWQYRTTRQDGKLVGFEFSNRGGNRILPPRHDSLKNLFFTRDFQFSFDERARQDIYLLISDWPPSRDRVFRLSELMNRMMLFFPRKYLPAIVNAGERNIVTLPTGEEVAFDAATHEVVDGVFAEAPVDLNPDRSARQYPSVEYRGRGVSIRADARGADPRMAKVAVITTGTLSAPCAEGAACGRCEVKPQELWHQSGAARFKFATDESFDRFLRERCGFGLPSLEKETTTAAAAR